MTWRPTSIPVLWALMNSSPKFGSAPAFNRAFTASTFPLTAATCKAVQPRGCRTFTSKHSAFNLIIKYVYQPPQKQLYKQYKVSTIFRHLVAVLE